MVLNKHGKIEAEIGEVLDFDGTLYVACPGGFCSVCAFCREKYFCHAVACTMKERKDKKPIFFKKKTRR